MSPAPLAVISRATWHIVSFINLKGWGKEEENSRGGISLPPGSARYLYRILSVAFWQTRGGKLKGVLIPLRVLSRGCLHPPSSHLWFEDVILAAASLQMFARFCPFLMTSLSPHPPTCFFSLSFSVSLYLTPFLASGDLEFTFREWQQISPSPCRQNKRSVCLQGYKIPGDCDYVSVPKRSDLRS